MKVVLAQNKLRVAVSNKNNIGKVTFGGVARIGSVSLGQLTDVSTTGQQDGDVLVYESSTNSYSVTTLPKIDGGTF